MGSFMKIMLLLKNFITLRAPDWFFIPLVNLNNKIKRRGVRVSLDSRNVYRIQDVNSVIYTCRRSRLGRYFFGIQEQIFSLSKSYLLDHVHVKSKDIIIDCGANNGEIGLWAKNYQLEYYAFEPEQFESRCCDLNNYDGEINTVRKGLWSKKTKLRWYSKPESADSSFVETINPSSVFDVETTTLNDFIHENDIEHVRIFKLEAEGAEPEVLMGCSNVFHLIDYIAIDCGYERGIEQKHTFIEVYNILKKHNFDIVAAEFRRVVFLFKRKDII
jgi:FkbM family methyltransferase